MITNMNGNLSEPPDTWMKSDARGEVCDATLSPGRPYSFIYLFDLTRRCVCGACEINNHFLYGAVGIPSSVYKRFNFLFISHSSMRHFLGLHCVTHWGNIPPSSPELIPGSELISNELLLKTFWSVEWYWTSGIREEEVILGRRCLTTTRSEHKDGPHSPVWHLHDSHLCFIKVF